MRAGPLAAVVAGCLIASSFGCRAHEKGPPPAADAVGPITQPIEPGRRPGGPSSLPGEFVIYTSRYGLLYAVDGGGRSMDALTTPIGPTPPPPYARFRLYAAGPQAPQYRFIETANGYALMAPDGGGRASLDAVVADLKGLPYGEYVAWAKFRFGTLLGGNGESTLQTSNGDFVTAVGGGGQFTNAVHTDARTASTWERFRVIKCGDLGTGLTYAIHSAGAGGILHALGGGGLTDGAITTGTIIDDAARFTLLRQADGSYALRTSNGVNYLTAVGGGGRAAAQSGNLHTDATHVQAWEKFRLLDMGDCTYTLQTVGGGLVAISAGDTSYIATNATDGSGGMLARFQFYMFDL